MPLGVLTFMFCATRPLLFLMYKLSNTKNTYAFNYKSNFLRIGLISHCLFDKGHFAPFPTKRRLAPAMGQDAHSNEKKIDITQTRPCNIVQYFMAVKMIIFR